MLAAAAHAIGLWATLAAALLAPVQAQSPAQSQSQSQSPVAAPEALVPARSRWPDRPIRLVVPTPQGGDADPLAGPLAAALGRQLGQAVVLDYRPGLGGNFGAEIVARSRADGYTFLLGSVEQVIAASLQPRAAYDPHQDLAPVTLLAVAPGVLVVSAAQASIADVADLVRQQRANPAQSSYASAGSGSLSHLAAERYLQATATGATHQPYRGTAAALADLQAGQVDFMVAPLPLALPAIRDGKLRALAVTGGSRSFALPSVPTLAQAGVGGIPLQAWYALWSPAGTPAAINLAMQQGVAAVLDQKDMVDVWNRLGAERGGQPHHVLGLLVRSEVLKWGQTIKALGIGPNQ